RCNPSRSCRECNGNGIPDDCDIADGTSEDCNENAVPDECDIADLTSWDCNHNGIPDECDIASGYSEDLNGDGIADECYWPGETGVVPLLQTRTLWAKAANNYTGCEEEDFDQAPDFSPYDNFISAHCGSGNATASQHSFVEHTDVRAEGSAHGAGVGGYYNDSHGIGESIYELVLGAPYDESALLSGQVAIEMPLGGDPYPVKSRVELLDVDQQVLFEVELYSEEEATVQFHEPVDLEQSIIYILRAEAYVVGSTWGGADGDAEFDLQLNALGDVDGDWDVDTADLLELLGAWGPNEDHPADFDGDGVVDAADLLALLGNWGP
ncbi:MAG: hypothetical protein SYC29_01315, partial [Planctomycetota bacterium]|nr:hypothetical protein [Planctomycetota bacterium]